MMRWGRETIVTYGICENIMGAVLVCCSNNIRSEAHTKRSWTARIMGNKKGLLKNDKHNSFYIKFRNNDYCIHYIVYMVHMQWERVCVCQKVKSFACKVKGTVMPLISMPCASCGVHMCIYMAYNINLQRCIYYIKLNPNKLQAASKEASAEVWETRIRSANPFSKGEGRGLPLRYWTE